MAPTVQTLQATSLATPLSERTLAAAAKLYAVATLLGSFLLVNQFGEALNKLVDISFLSVFWSINVAVSWMGFGTVFFVLMGLLTFHFQMIRDARLRTAFNHGLLTGTFAVPAIAAAVFTVGAALWLVVQVLRLVVFVVGVVMIPFVWLIEHILFPVVAFLATPFVWLWKVLLYPVLKVIAIPFVWIGKHVLYPIIAVLARFILLPALILVVGIIASGLILLVPAALGRTYLYDLEIASRETHDAHTLFSHGVGFGLTVFGAFVTFALTVAGVISEQPSLALFASLAIPAIFAFKYSERQPRRSSPLTSDLPYPVKLKSYWLASGLGFVLQICLVPLGVALSMIVSHTDE